MTTLVVSHQDVVDLQPYQYAPLEGATDIRLVELFPGKADDVTSCTLRHVSLDAKPEFEALSYVWGDPQDVHYIICNGCRLRIYGNLSQALRALRLEAAGPPRVLWIDAIAINQQDMEERSTQVQLMGKIYGLATSVPIWLGPADEDTKQACDLIIQISTAFKEVSATPEYIKAVEKGEKFSIAKFDIPAAYEDTWSGLTQLLQRDWFSRVWVLQEAILAAKALLICGDFTVDLQYLEMVLLGLYRTSEWHREFLTWYPTFHRFEACIKSTMQLRKIRTEQEYADLRTRKFQLYSLVRDTRLRNATDPRDKIYCMLGLASDLDTHPFIPDYTLPVGRVYADFTRRFIRQNGSLSCFLDITSFEYRQGEDTVPSWVADWRYASGDSAEVLLKRKKPFCATLSSKARISDPTSKNPPDPLLLTLRGFRLTTIAETINCDFFEMFQRHIGGDIYPKTGERMDSLTFYSRLCTNDLYDNFFDDQGSNTTDGGESTREQEDAMLARLQAPFIQPPHSDLDAGAGTFSFYTINPKSHAFVSADGYIGTSDGWMKAGDEIWLLEGADRPYILRRIEFGLRIIVEEAYVHGAMYGEVWPSAEKALQEVVLA